MKISVVMVTNRKGWKPILDDDMARQTFRDFEVIVADDLYDENPDNDPLHFKPRQKQLNDAWNLNKAYNDALGKVKGELVVFLQDFIWIPANGLERFWDVYQANPKAIVTGVGHKAKDGLEGISEVDERVMAGEGLTPGNMTHWELNWASCPVSAGPRFNEAMDAFYGGENQYIARQCELKGYKILVDHKNQCIGYSQEYCGGRPLDWEELHTNKEGRLTKFIKELELQV